MSEEVIQKFAIPLVQQRHPLTEISIWKALPFLAKAKKWRNKLPSWLPRTHDSDSSDDELFHASTLESLPSGTLALTAESNDGAFTRVKEQPDPLGEVNSLVDDKKDAEVADSQLKT